ncbi:hypothetical protein [Mesoterricola silvestris]|nr:hypothetical protein [Mesoterricola silvestris]
MEIHWLITWHDLNLRECSGTTTECDRDWSALRREELLTAWDRTPGGAK